MEVLEWHHISTELVPLPRPFPQTSRISLARIGSPNNTSLQVHRRTHPGVPWRCWPYIGYRTEFCDMLHSSCSGMEQNLLKFTAREEHANFQKIKPNSQIKGVIQKGTMTAMETITFLLSVVWHRTNEGSLYQIWASHQTVEGWFNPGKSGDASP